jgi:hypothetical protein
MKIKDDFESIKNKIMKKILKIKGISKEKENIFSIDGTSYIIEVKEE